MWVEMGGKWSNELADQVLPNPPPPKKKNTDGETRTRNPWITNPVLPEKQILPER